MVLVANWVKVFNMLAGGVVALAMTVSEAPMALAAPGDDVPVRVAPSPEPVLTLEPPDGHCVFNTAEAEQPGRATGFEPGLKTGMELMALYVPCASLDAARSGSAEWLPEWVAIEKNIVTYPSDDERGPGAHGAVAQLCQDAQSARWGHPRYEGAEFSEMVQVANAKLSNSQPEVFLGVIGEDEHACYLSSLKIVSSPSGKPQRFLIVAAFMQVGDRWVTQSLRRQLDDTREGAKALLAAAKKQSKSFAEKNR